MKRNCDLKRKQQKLLERKIVYEMDYDDLELDEFTRVNIRLTFYLKKRQEPLQLAMGVPIKKDGPIKSVGQLMDQAYRQIMTDMDSKSSKVLTFEDEGHNHFSVMMDEVQGFEIKAPENIPSGYLEEDEDYE